MNSSEDINNDVLHRLSTSIKGGDLNSAIDNLVKIMGSNMRVKIDVVDNNQKIFYVNQQKEIGQKRDMDVLDFWEQNQEEILKKNNLSL